MKKTISMMAVTMGVLTSQSCGSDTCGDFACSSFKNFGGPADKEVYNCVSTINDTTHYVLKDKGVTLIDCKDRKDESGCRLSFYAARENACK